MKKLLLIILLLTNISAHADTHSKIERQLSEFIQNVENPNLQGGVIAIIYHGHVIYTNEFGFQKNQTGPITKDTLFPLASVSKSVSATAVALLVNEGKVNLDEKFTLPYLKNPVSLRNILSHTTGYKFSGNAQIEQGMPREKLLQKLKEHKPSCQPGECYQYSNTTFSLLDEALKTKKLSLKDAIENLKKSLKTDEIQILPLNYKAQIAYPHIKVKGKKAHSIKALPMPPYYPKAAPAAAGVFASLNGMIELFKLQFGHRPDLISKQTLDQFYKPVIANRDIENWGIKWPCPLDEIESYYGAGWRILKAKKYPGHDLIFHGGMISGISTFVGYIPLLDLGVIILTNQSSGFATREGIHFWGLFLECPSENGWRT